MDLVLQFLGLFLLLGGLGLGYQRWVRPRTELSSAAKGLLFLVITTMMGGLLGSPFWWFDFPQSFAWEVPPLASRMLASAGWAFMVMCFLALKSPSYRRIRVVLLLIFVYLTPLAIAIVFFHLDRFDFSKPLTYSFFIIALSLAGVTITYLFRQPTLQPENPKDGMPASPALIFWLGLVALITALWGTALFFTDSGPIPLIWVWPGDLLSSRLIGVMLLSIAVGTGYGLRHQDSARLMLATVTIYGIGLSIASLWNLLVGKPVPLSYLIVFGLIALISAVFLFRKPLQD